MDILTKSDAEILEIAEPMWDDIRRGSNEQNWDLFSKYMLEEHSTDKFKKDVESQWSNNKVLTSLTAKREYLSILRKNDCVLVLWKQWSTKVEGEFLAMLYLQSIDDEVKAIGIWIK
ncbi:MAG: hypothetical protein AAFY63_11195 [Cyanobacteria bacterium J06643_13]